MEDGKGMLDGRRKEQSTALHIASHSHPPIAFASASLPLFTPFLHLSNFKATWRENMSVTGGIILGGQCFSLKHAQQIHAISHEASSEWQLISSACHPLHRLLRTPSAHLSTHLIWSISILFSVLIVLLSGLVAEPQSEAVELLPGGPHLRGLTAACIISPSAWILIGPDQRTGWGGWRQVLVLQLDWVCFKKGPIGKKSKKEQGLQGVGRKCDVYKLCSSMKAKFFQTTASHLTTYERHCEINQQDSTYSHTNF